MRSAAVLFAAALLSLSASTATAVTIDPNPFWVFDGAAAGVVELIEEGAGLPSGPAGEPADIQLGSVGPGDLTYVFQLRLAGPSPDFGAIDVTIRDALGAPVPIVGAGTVLIVHTDLEAMAGTSPGNVVFQAVDALGDPSVIENESDWFFLSFAGGTDLVGGSIEVFDPLTGATGSASFVPEPGFLALIGTAGLAIAAARRPRRVSRRSS